MFALALIFASATKARTAEWVSPWAMEVIEPYSDCAQLCGNWSALYLTDKGCKGNDMVIGDNQQFCPNMDEVEAWTVDDEKIYTNMYHRADELSIGELEILERMSFERMMKLSVHPWQKFQFKEIRSLMERRRKQASSTSFRCIGSGPGVNERSKHYLGERPTKVTLEFKDEDGEDIISYFEMKYPSGKMYGGGEDDGTVKKKKVPACTTIVFGKTDNVHVNALNFLSQGKETKLMGEDINESVILVAPSGYCLGDMRMRHGDLVDRLCFRFNSEE